MLISLLIITALLYWSEGLFVIYLNPIRSMTIPVATDVDFLG